MPDAQDKTVSKARLDSDNILPQTAPESGSAQKDADQAAAVAPDEKATLDAEDVLPADMLQELDETAPDEKVTLDKEGIPQEDAAQELEVPQHLSAAPPEPHEAEKPHAAAVRFDFSRFTKLPFSKIAVTGSAVAVFILLAFAGWFAVRLLLKPAPAHEEEAMVEQEQVVELAESSENQTESQTIEVELEPFVVPLQGGTQGFVRFSLLLSARRDAASAIQQQRERLRLTIYTMIQQTDSAVLSAQDGQERIRTELQKLLNTILGGEYILNVGFLRLMVL